jgi:hypothetical protein
MLQSAYANIMHIIVEANLLDARGVLFIVFRCVDQELPPLGSAIDNYSADHDSRSDGSGPSIGSGQTISAHPGVDSSHYFHRLYNGGIWPRTMLRPQEGSGHAVCILTRTNSSRREDCESHMLRGIIYIAQIEKNR